MPARKLQPVAPPDEESTPTAEEQFSYAFEPLDDELRSQLNVWGNSTVLAINKLREKYPNWAQMIEDLFSAVGLVIENQEQ